MIAVFEQVTGPFCPYLESRIGIISLHAPEKQGDLLKKFTSRMGMKEPLTMDKLTEITENIRVLEMVLSTKHLKSIEAVFKAETPDGNEFYNHRSPESYEPADHTDLVVIDGSPGDFSTDNKYATKIKAAKYFDKGYTVQSVKENNRKEPEVLNIIRCEDIFQCDAFIAQPPVKDSVTETALPRTPDLYKADTTGVKLQ